MGMIATYFSVDDFTLNKLKKDLTCWELHEDDDIEYCDIDKTWHGLYFLLSGNENPEYNDNNFSDFAKDVFIFGEEIMSNEEHFYYIPKENVSKILQEINKINFEELDFNTDTFKANEIYPNIWDEDKELLLEELEMSFNILKNFYKIVEETHQNIIVTIG